MSNIIDVTTLHGTKIKYDPDKKQFFADIGGREIRKSSQGEVEKFISRLAGKSERIPAIILDYSWHQVTVRKVEIVGLRRNKAQFKTGHYMESESVENVYVFSEKVLEEGEKLKKEYSAWSKRWMDFVNRADRIDPETLR